MSAIELELRPHEAGTIITILTERVNNLQVLAGQHERSITELIEQNCNLEAEIDGMNAGANLQLEHTSSGMTAAEWRATAVTLNGEFVEWIRAIEARLNAVDTLNSIDGETVRTNLTPFINTVRGWMNSINETINNSSQEDN